MKWFLRELLGGIAFVAIAMIFYILFIYAFVAVVAHCVEITQ